MRSRRITVWLVLVLLAGAVLAWASWPVTLLEIRAGEGGPVLKRYQVSVGERVTYTYVHSVQRRPVAEIMEVGPAGQFIVRETIYDMYGAGLPSDLPDGTATVDPATGKFRITGMSRELPVWRVRVAFTAEQTLRVGDETVRLDSLAPPTTLLTVTVSRHSRISAV